MRPFLQFRIVLGALAALALVAPRARAQALDEPEAPSPAPAVTIEEVEARIKQVQEAKELDEAARTALVDLLQKGAAELRKAAELRDAAAAARKAIEAGPVHLELMRKELAEPVPEPKIEPPPDATLAILDAELAEEVAALAGAQKELADRQNEQKRRSQRKVENPRELAAAKESLEKVRAEMAAPPAAGELPQLGETRRLVLQARQERLAAEVTFLEEEVPGYDRRAELLTARIARWTRNVSLAEKRVSAWRDLVSERRRVEAERQAREAERARMFAIEEVKKYADENAGFAEQRQQLLADMKKVDADLTAVQKELGRIDTAFKGLAEQVKTMGLTRDIGLLLRDHKKKLGHRLRLHSRSIDIAEVQFRKFQLDDAMLELGLVDALEARVAALKQEILAAGAQVAESVLETSLRELLSARREILGPLLVDLDAYITSLFRLDSARNQLETVRADFAAFIDERVLWIRSADFVKPVDLKRDWEALVSLAAPAKWADTLGAVGSGLLDDPLPVIPAIVGLAVLGLLAPRLRRRLRELGEKASRVRTDAFSHTVRALLITAGLSLFWPATTVFTGWIFARYASMAAAPEVAAAASTAFLRLGVFLGIFELLRQVCRAGGLAEAHFRWDAGAIRALRWNTAWFLPMFLPLGVVAAALRDRALDLDPESQALGRIPSLAAFLAMSVFLGMVFHPRRGAFRAPLDRHRTWFARLRYLWFGLAVGLPVALAVAAAIGYYYTARALVESLLSTVWLVLAFALLQSMALRWLLVNKRRLVIEQALAKRAAAAAAREQEAASGAEGGEPPPQKPIEEEVDLEKINVQTSNLLRTTFAIAFLVGAWFIWSDELPALRILDTVTLGWAKAIDPETQAGIPATLADLLFSLVAGALTVVAARNLPGFLQMAVLQRLPLDRGARYAITTLTSYVITLVGFVVAFNAVGLGWSKVQWLAAALTVGLGFGLQEIFANFVSGLILLFERPIRVGDTVTVGDVSGTVTQIRTRATIITNWDRQELLVPNKELITGRVMNWTLSDPITRVVVPVGIAYGSDTATAREILLRVASENPRVLDEPAPTAFFLAFGESSLGFELRVFARKVEDIMALKHELHYEIDQAFRRAGIEIPFPQRDINIKTAPVPGPIERQYIPGE